MLSGARLAPQTACSALLGSAPPLASGAAAAVLSSGPVPAAPFSRPRSARSGRCGKGSLIHYPVRRGLTSTLGSGQAGSLFHPKPKPSPWPESAFSGDWSQVCLANRILNKPTAAAPCRESLVGEGQNGMAPLGEQGSEAYLTNPGASVMLRKPLPSIAPRVGVCPYRPGSPGPQQSLQGNTM